jgi:hypothetical protein
MNKLINSTENFQTYCEGGYHRVYDVRGGVADVFYCNCPDK